MCLVSELIYVLQFTPGIYPSDLNKSRNYNMVMMSKGVCKRVLNTDMEIEILVMVSNSQVLVCSRARSGNKKVPVRYRICILWCRDIEGEARAEGVKHLSIEGETREKEGGGVSVSPSPENF